MRRVLGLTLGKAWDDDIFSHSAQAAFWQALSLPPLFLALLGSLGFVGGWFGPETVQLVDGTIIDFARRVFTADVVDEIIAPTANDILNKGRADVVSVGFVVSLWAMAGQQLVYRELLVPSNGRLLRSERPVAAT